MKVFGCIRRFFNIAFAIYTCVSFGMMICNRILDVKQAPTWGGVALMFGQIGLFAVLCALCSTILSVFKKLNGVISNAIMFVCSYSAFYLCFFVLVNSAQPINIIVISTVFVVIYAVVKSFAALFVKLESPKKSVEYQSVYTKE